MLSRTIMGIAWPAFMTACVLELVVFGLFDPHDMTWSGHALAWSRQGIYTVSFFVFWVIAATCSTLTSLLAMTAPPAGGRPAD